MKNDTELMCKAINKNEYLIDYYGKKFTDKKEFVIPFLKNLKNWYSFRKVSKKLKDDEEVVLTVISQNGCALEYASDRLKDDDEIVRKAVCESGYAMKDASDRLKDNEKIVLAAISQSPLAFKFASDRLKENAEFVLTCISKENGVLEFASDKLKNNVDFMIKAIDINPHVLRFASKEITENEEVVMKAYLKDHSILRYVDKKLRNNRTLFPLEKKDYVDVKFCDSETIYTYLKPKDMTFTPGQIVQLLIGNRRKKVVVIKDYKCQEKFDYSYKELPLAPEKTFVIPDKYKNVDIYARIGEIRKRIENLKHEITESSEIIKKIKTINSNEELNQYLIEIGNEEILNEQTSQEGSNE